MSPLMEVRSPPLVHLPLLAQTRLGPIEFNTPLSGDCLTAHCPARFPACLGPARPPTAPATTSSISKTPRLEHKSRSLEPARRRQDAVSLLHSAFAAQIRGVQTRGFFLSALTTKMSYSNAPSPMLGTSIACSLTSIGTPISQKNPAVRGSFFSTLSMKFCACGIISHRVYSDSNAPATVPLSRQPVHQ